MFFFHFNFLFLFLFILIYLFLQKDLWVNFFYYYESCLSEHIKCILILPANAKLIKTRILFFQRKISEVQKKMV